MNDWRSLKGMIQPFAGAVQLTSCLIKNTNAAEMPPYSIGKVTGQSAVNSVDKLPTGNTKVIECDQPTGLGEEVFVSSGPIAIPAGKTGPGYMGSLLPITATASTPGITFKPVGSAWTVEAGPGRLVQLMQRGSLVLFLQKPPALSQLRGTVVSDFTSGDTISLNTLVGIDGDATGISTPLSVVNIYGQSGSSGDKLKADWNIELGRWESGFGGGGGGGSSDVQMVAFTLTEDMGATTAGEASATTDQHYGGTAPTDPITVLDIQTLYRHAKSGAKGWAWNAGDGSYVVLVCDQPALQIKATIAESGTGSDVWGLTPNESTGKIAVGYSALTDQPFGQLIANLDSGTIPNPLGIYADTGDTVTLQFDQSTGSYFFLNAEKPCFRIKGTATADWGSASSISLGSVVGMDGVAPATTATVVNTFGWAGESGMIVTAELNILTGEYEARQVECP